MNPKIKIVPKMSAIKNPQSNELIEPLGRNQDSKTRTNRPPASIFHTPFDAGAAELVVGEALPAPDPRDPLLAILSSFNKFVNKCCQSSIKFAVLGHGDQGVSGKLSVSHFRVES